MERLTNTPRYTAYIIHDAAHMRRDGYAELKALTLVGALEECEEHFNEFITSALVFEYTGDGMYSPTVLTRDGVTWRVCRKRGMIKRYGEGAYNVIECESEGGNERV